MHKRGSVRPGTDLLLTLLQRDPTRNSLDSFLLEHNIPPFFSATSPRHRPSLGGPAGGFQTRRAPTGPAHDAAQIRVGVPRPSSPAPRGRRSSLAHSCKEGATPRTRLIKFGLRCKRDETWWLSAGPLSLTKASRSRVVPTSLGCADVSTGHTRWFRRLC